MNPSLLLIPDRYKAGKLYSQIPDTGAGDFTVTRGTTATRVNASGLIESVASGVPRIDYTGGGCGKLLVEPQRTNLIRFSEQLNNAAWIKVSSGTGSNPVVTANSAISPDGFQNADSIFFDAGAGTSASDQSQIYQEFSVSAGVFTASFYAKTASGTAQMLYRIDGSIYEKLTITNQWQRFVITKTLLAGANFFEINLRRGIDEPLNASATIQIWGAQIEAGSVATSYIPTVASTVTRNADVISLSSVSGLIGQTEGTIYCEFDWRSRTEAAARIVFGVEQVGTNNNIRISFGGTNQLQITGLAFNGALLSFSQASLGQFPQGRTKAALAYDFNGIQLFVNGTALALGVLTGSYPLLNGVVLGNRNSDQFFNDRVTAAAIYTTRLSNAELTQLTTL